MLCVALDAMGVIFRAADDVGDLLVPFIAEAGGETNAGAIESSYLDASLGRIDADEFWRRVGLDSSVEDEYLKRHTLTSGVQSFLACTDQMGIPVWCLSNDVERWSIKLRASFGLNKSLSGAIISGTVGVRKPNRAIYQLLLEASGYRAEELVFIDDRAKNVAAAQSMGIPARLFSQDLNFFSLEKLLRAGTLQPAPEFNLAKS